MSSIQLGNGVFLHLQSAQLQLCQIFQSQGKAPGYLGLREFLPAHSQCSGAFLHGDPAGQELDACPALG